MASFPLISVIVPAFNAESTIREAVESVLAQSYRPLEILVVDDGSTDGTFACSENIHPDVRVIQQVNAGPSAARNHGIREAKGSWIAFLDSDDIWLPEKLAQQWECVSKNSSIGFVHTDVTFFDPDSNKDWQTDVGRDKFVGRCTDKLLRENRILTSSVLVDRKYLDQTDLFDEKYWVAEDYDLWLRLSTQCEFAYLSSPLVRYRMQGDSLSTYSLRMRKSELAVFQKAITSIADSTQMKQGSSSQIDELRTRLLQLHWDIGSLAFEENRFTEARPHLWQVIKLNPWKLRAWYLWLSTCLPENVVNRMRQWKQGLSSSQKQYLTK